MQSTALHRFIGTAFAAMMLLLGVGCSSPSTRINFVAPPATVMTVDGTPHHLPSSIALTRPSNIGEPKRHSVSLVSTAQGKEVRATGYINVFGYTESDLDKVAVPTCNLDELHLAQILDGTIVVFRGESASRQHLYDLTLKK